jgi:hypothetical protein
MPMPLKNAIRTCMSHTPHDSDMLFAQFLHNNYTTMLKCIIFFKKEKLGAQQVLVHNLLCK